MCWYAFHSGVGRLAPQIGDYDSAMLRIISALFRRKTCPTNRGLRPAKRVIPFILMKSEDLPHKSGITTLTITRASSSSSSEDLPHKSGITTHNPIPPASRYSRKTCPTNRGLRRIFQCRSLRRSQSEDLPHKSGITTSGAVHIQRCIYVGRLAPQIGDYDTIKGFYGCFQFCRKTCPTNRGLRRRNSTHLFIFNLSEDLPHKSGITTNFTVQCTATPSRKTCPTNRGLRLLRPYQSGKDRRRKTCPTNRGLRQIQKK